jgi:hypothetical protein
MKVALHGLLFIAEITTVDMAGVPFDEDVPEIEYDGLDGRGHPAILTAYFILPDAAITLAIPAAAMTVDRYALIFSPFGS